MKAIVISRLGGPDALEVRDVPDPVASAGHELVRVQAGGLNFADVMTTQGGYPGTPKPPLGGRPRVLWRKGERRTAGHGIRAVGERSLNASPLARSCCGRSRETWTAEEGAAFPVNYFTAYFAYWKAGLSMRRSQQRLGAGPRVLIHAVAGGVGTAAVQIGKLLGVEMYGTSSSDEKLARVKELGLQHGINYKQHDYEEAIKDLTKRRRRGRSI